MRWLSLAVVAFMAVVGPPEWDAPDMVAFLKSIIAEKLGWFAVLSQKEDLS
ncbi:hypothetical protein [Hyphomicrobium sp.]|uniref:hypothetical protein n=1 Tax=Hyphomicrobium sp. TaxID=82 RepID=UPI0025C4DA98|nr:hypothetical protein [Hyphomicrobium sp.]